MFILWKMRFLISECLNKLRVVAQVWIFVCFWGIYSCRIEPRDMLTLGKLSVMPNERLSYVHCSILHYVKYVKWSACLRLDSKPQKESIFPHSHTLNVGHYILWKEQKKTSRGCETRRNCRFMSSGLGEKSHFFRICHHKNAMRKSFPSNQFYYIANSFQVAPSVSKEPPAGAKVHQ